MCTSHYLDLFITGVIGLNVITMAMEHYQQPKVLQGWGTGRAVLGVLLARGRSGLLSDISLPSHSWLPAQSRALGTWIPLHLSLPVQCKLTALKMRWEWVCLLCWIRLSLIFSILLRFHTYPLLPPPLPKKKRKRRICEMESFLQSFF